MPAVWVDLKAIDFSKATGKHEDAVLDLTVLRSCDEAATAVTLMRKLLKKHGFRFSAVPGVMCFIKPT